MSNGVILSTYASHNAAVAMYHNDTYYVVELERWLNKKNSGLVGYLEVKSPQRVFDDVIEYLLGVAGTRKIDLHLTNYMSPKIDISKYDIRSTRRYDHHDAHAACAYYQSEFDKALIFTYDGGGNGSFFNVYKAERRASKPELIQKLNIDMGFPYMILADHLADIKRDPLNIGNLVYAGKLMGLCAYGEVVPEWVPHFRTFYEKFRYGGNAYIGGAEVRVAATQELMDGIGLGDGFSLDETRFEGKTAWDIAATSQQTFEDLFFDLATPYFKEYPDYPVCLAGGCALNVILNSKIAKYLPHNNLFIPPNTNDCGIAVGGLLNHLNPMERVDLTYSGLPVMDASDYTFLYENTHVKALEGATTDDIATLLAENYIVGVINGNSEHGPRALGNRSILCNPVGDMKDVLNKKVKDREWYRPFAPVVRFEDVSKYFDFELESRHMTFVAKVRDEYDFPAITHVDGTGRLQTVKRDQNEFLYDIITKTGDLTGNHILLNTSFNVNGKPILTRISDAFDILTSTELDCVYYDNMLVYRANRENEINNLLRPSNISMDHNINTVYVMAYYESPNSVAAIKHIITEIYNDHPRVKVIINKDHTKIIPDVHPRDIIERGPAQYYYSELLSCAGITTDIYKFIRHLWVKDIIIANELNSDYHIVVDLSIDGSYDQFKKLTTTLMTRPILDDKILLSTGKDPVGITVRDFTYKLPRYSGPDINPTFGVYAGYTELMAWFLKTYEGNFRYHLINGRGKSDNDYLLIQFVENQEKFITLE